MRQRACNRSRRRTVIPNSGRKLRIIGQPRTTKEIGRSVLIYVLTLPFLKPRKDALRLLKVSLAGMEPLGRERHGRSPQGRGAGALRSIEPSRRTTTKLPTIWHIAECPRREWSPRERRGIDEAQRASAWVMRESIEPRSGTTTKFTHCKRSVVVCPRREWSRWEACDMDEARRVSSRERANQSNQDVKQPLSSPTAKERRTVSPAGIEPTFKV
jgi:hypothetical protein